MKMLVHLVSETGCRRALVIGIGGGGDVVSAIHIAHRLEALGCRASIGSVPWERWVTDPAPGPVGLNDLVNALRIGGYALASGRTMACRTYGCFRLQASRLAGVLGRPVVLVPIDRSVQGFLEAIRDYSSWSGLDLVIGVDAGGDVLAQGCEEELWSPLADQVALAGLWRAGKELGARSIVAVHGLGCDGELDRASLLKHLAEIARRGGVLGFDGLSAWDKPLLEKVLGAVKTEASRLPYQAFNGVYGELVIRRGTRKVKVDLLSSTTIFLDIETVFKASPMARSIAYTDSIWRARDALNSMGIYTELDLEIDLLRGMKPGEARRKGRMRLSHFRGKQCI